VGLRSYVRNFVNPGLVGCWRHSLACALVSEPLAAACSIERNQAYAAALMHDISRLTPPPSKLLRARVCWPKPKRRTLTHWAAKRSVRRGPSGSGQVAGGTMESAEALFACCCSPWRRSLARRGRYCKSGSASLPRGRLHRFSGGAFASPTPVKIRYLTGELQEAFERARPKVGLQLKSEKPVALPTDPMPSRLASPQPCRP